MRLLLFICLFLVGAAFIAFIAIIALGCFFQFFPNAIPGLTGIIFGVLCIPFLHAWASVCMSLEARSAFNHYMRNRP